MNEETPRIYVRCLAAYNNGILHGDCIDASQGVCHLWDGINTILKTSPIPNAEEWAIHDYENFGDIRLSEYESIDKVAALADFIAIHGELGSEIYTHYGHDIEKATEVLEENYHGEYKSEEDFAQSLIEDTSDLSGVPPFLLHHIDWQSVARDLFMDGYTSFYVNGSYHVFSDI